MTQQLGMWLMSLAIRLPPFSAGTREGVERRSRSDRGSTRSFLSISTTATCIRATPEGGARPTLLKLQLVRYPATVHTNKHQRQRRAAQANSPPVLSRSATLSRSQSWVARCVLNTLLKNSPRPIQDQLLLTLLLDLVQIVRKPSLVLADRAVLHKQPAVG